MANESALAGLAAFGTGFLNSLSAQREERRAAATKRRQLEFRLKLDEQMRKAREKDEQAKALRAADVMSEARGSFALPRPTNNAVTSRMLHEHEMAAYNKTLTDSIRAGLSFDAATKAAEDMRDQAVEMRQNTYNQMLMKSFGLFERGRNAEAMQWYAEAVKHSPGMLNVVYDPRSESLQDTDDELNPMGQPYRLTRSDYRDRLMKFDDVYADQRLREQALVNNQLRANADARAERAEQRQQRVADQNYLLRQAGYSLDVTKAQRAERDRTAKQLDNLLGVPRLEARINSLYKQAENAAAFEGLEDPNAEARQLEINALEADRSRLVSLSAALADSKQLPENAAGSRTVLSRIAKLIEGQQVLGVKALPGADAEPLREIVRGAGDTKYSKDNVPIAKVLVGNDPVWVTRSVLEILKHYGMQ